MKLFVLRWLTSVAYLVTGLLGVLTFGLLDCDWLVLISQKVYLDEYEKSI